MDNDLVSFEGNKIRRVYDEPKDTWYFSVVDIVQVNSTAGFSSCDEIL